MIVTLLIPHFVSAVARQQRGLPAAVPVVVISKKQVVACCALARTQGVRIGMTLQQAKWLCPAAIDMAMPRQAIKQATDAILNALFTFTSLVEQTDSLSWLDDDQSAVFAADLEKLLVNDARAHAVMMQQAAARCTGLLVRYGLASAKFTAYAGALTGKTHVPPEEAKAFLAPLPITLLPIDQERKRRLAILGLVTIDALAALPLAALYAQFGKVGYTLYQICRGLDPARVMPARPEIVAQVSRRFDTPVDDSQFLSRALESAAAELAGKMRLSGKMGRTVRLHIACAGGLERRERSALRQPVSSTPYIADAVLRVFQRMKISAPVLYLTVSLTDLIPFAGHQLELFGEPPKPRERLQSAITTILRYPDAPEAYWINAAAPDAYRIEQRYEFERISAL